MEIKDLKFKDIELFIKLYALLNVRELSRREGLSPGQISKIIKSLEMRLNHKLFERSGTGLKPTVYAKKTLPKMKKIHESFSLLKASSKEEGAYKNHLYVASTSFLTNHSLPTALANYSSDYKFSIVDVPATEFILSGLRSSFDLCFHVGKLDWPQTWHSKKIGEISFQAYAYKNHPIFKSKNKSHSIKKYPFVSPLYWTPNGYQIGNDKFPKSFKRKEGHTTQTALSAAQICRKSDHLAFLPCTVAHMFSDLKAIQIKGLQTATEEVYGTAQVDNIKQKVFDDLCARVRKEL